MNAKKSTPLSLAVGAALVASLAGMSANASDNPFSARSLGSGYMVAAATDGKCGQGKCGGMAKATSAKAGEGKCGAGRCDMADGNNDGKVSKEEFAKHHDAMFKAMDTNKDGFLDKSEMGKMMEGKCGGAKPAESKCGGAKAPEGKCGGAKAPEGKCGGAKAPEGKCGGAKVPEAKCGGMK